MGKQQLKGQITLSLESVSSRMYRAASVELYGEPYRTLDELLALDRRDHRRTTSREWRASSSPPSDMTVVQPRARRRASEFGLDYVPSRLARCAAPLLRPAHSP